VISGIPASLSGLTNALRRLELTANNIANQSTPGYQVLRAENLDVAQGGVRVAAITENASPAAPTLDAAGFPILDGSNVDPAVEQVNLLLNQRQFEANLSVIKTQNQLLDSLLPPTPDRA